MKYVIRRRDFISATPDGKRRMVANHFNLVCGRANEQVMIIRVFSSCRTIILFHPVIPSSIAISRHPEILEDKQAVFVAGVKKFRPFDQCASPDADEVEIHITVKPDL